MSDLKSPTSDPRCGTYAGVGVRCRRGERSCDLCRRAAADYERQRPARKAERKAVLPVAIDLDGQGICARPEYRESGLWDEHQPGETVAEVTSRWSHAQLICHACPVLTQCAQMAESEPSFAGVWAGRMPPLPRQSGRAKAHSQSRGVRRK